MIYLDSDGVFAGWREYVFTHHIRNMGPEEFNKLPELRRRSLLRDIYQKDPDLFYKLKPITGTEKILEAVERTCEDWAILTSSAEDHFDFGRVVECKHLWYAKHFGISADKVIVTESSAAKKEFAGRGHLLVDDFRRNCNEWAIAGGLAIWTLTDKPNIDGIIQQVQSYQNDSTVYNGHFISVR